MTRLPLPAVAWPVSPAPRSPPPPRPPACCAGAPVAHAQPEAPSATVHYTFTTLDNQGDPTFNQLLGINSHNEISGYFGSGQPGHPNKGYTSVPPYGQQSYAHENFPGSAQTQVTGLNNKGDTVGFWVNGDGTRPRLRRVERRLHLLHRSAHARRCRLGQPAARHQQHRHRGRLLCRQARHRPPGQAQPGDGRFTGHRQGHRANSFASGINDRGDITGFAITSPARTAG